MESKRAFYELHAILLIYTFHLWVSEYAKTKPLPPNFNTILLRAKLDALHTFLESPQLTTLAVLKTWGKNLIRAKFNTE